ncbi:CU044_2847 family protein [Crocosphaera watsonii]|uniref:ATP-dependent RNA helicase RhlE n=1 Tax=Crocosphaera watsonii WH 0401 TaxID=555881 RepID=T2J7U1_CROWT|nr:CU044_2847 family protein [Crocosphaera watsonii]CCQ61235.1 ATP-dependent RNA helicase RhlE [Crocosphaera watsonii WH 0401]
MTYSDEIKTLKFSNGTEIKVEAIDLGGETRVGVDDILDFDDVTNAIEAIATSITTTLDKVKPKKASVEFGIKVGVESGKLTTLLVKGSGEANLKITLEW